MEIFFEYIKKDELDEAIQFFQRELLRKKNFNNLFVKEISDTLIVIACDLRNLNKNIILGIIDRNQSNMERNQIVNRLITLSNRYSKIDFSTKEEKLKYPPDLIQKTLISLESKFNPNGYYINNLKKILVNDIVDFVSKNIYDVFIEIVKNNSYQLPPNSQIFSVNIKESEVRDNIFNWLSKAETRQHINRMINNWHELNSKYIEDEIKYVYKMHDINPDEFWPGYHIVYPDIIIDAGLWSTRFSKSIINSYKKGSAIGEFLDMFSTYTIFKAGEMLFGGKSEKQSESLDRMSLKIQLSYILSSKILNSIVREEIDKNIYIRKSLNSFSDNWIVNNVIIQFEYLKMLKYNT